MLSFHPLCKSGLNFGRISRKLGTSGQRQLFKKFLFHVHPDFFHNEKSLQHINATNLSILQGIIDKTSPIDTAEIKSLTFYLKPELVGSTAQKVRVSTTRIEKSITEILETIGVEIPSESENDSNLFRSSHSTVMASADQTMEFLNSMFERKALMALREIRSTELKQLEKVTMVERSFVNAFNVIIMLRRHFSA